MWCYSPIHHHCSDAVSSVSDNVDMSAETLYMHADIAMSFPTDDMQHVNRLFTNYFPEESHVEGDLVTWGLMTDSNNRQCLELILHVAYPGFIRVTTAISEMVISHLHLHDPGKARISYPGVIELLA